MGAQPHGDAGLGARGGLAQGSPLLINAGIYIYICILGVFLVLFWFSPFIHNYLWIFKFLSELADALLLGRLPERRRLRVSFLGVSLGAVGYFFPSPFFGVFFLFFFF